MTRSQKKELHKKGFKKKVMIITTSLFLAVGGTQVFAATALDTNIIQLIKSGVSSMRDYFVGDAGKAVTQDLKTDYQKKIDTYVKAKTSSVIADLEGHKNNEVNRANKELNDYFEQMKQDVDDAAKTEVDVAKKAITDEVNKDIASTKSGMTDDLAKSIKEQFKR